MTVDQLKRKYEAEIEIYPKCGLFKRYSFLLRLSGDHLTTRRILLQENFSKKEIAHTKSKINYYNRKKNQSMMSGSAF